MPGTTIKDAAATQLLDGSAYTADIAEGTTDFNVPFIGDAQLLLEVGTVSGTNPVANIQVSAGDGTNWARCGVFRVDEDDANSSFAIPVCIDNGPFLTVAVDLEGTSPSFELTLTPVLKHHDRSPLMAEGDGANHTTPSPSNASVAVD